MNHTSDLIWLTLIISGIALLVGYRVACTWAIRPTLGDTLLGALKYPGIPALLLISFLWWALG